MPFFQISIFLILFVQCISFTVPFHSPVLNIQTKLYPLSGQSTAANVLAARHVHVIREHDSRLNMFSFFNKNKEEEEYFYDDEGMNEPVASESSAKTREDIDKDANAAADANETSTTTTTTTSGKYQLSTVNQKMLESAANFMISSFWTASTTFATTTTSSNSLSGGAKESLFQAQLSDFETKYGERMGKRFFNSRLIQATTTTSSNDEIVGIVGMEMTLMERISTQKCKIWNPEHAEEKMKTTLSSLGPKQRRQYKDYDIRELVEELLPNMVPICCLSNLAVSPNIRRGGIGAFLCEEVERVANEEWNFENLYLKVEGDNVSAKGLYEGKLGYEVVSSDEDALALRVDMDTGNIVEVVSETFTMCKIIVS